MLQTAATEIGVVMASISLIGVGVGIGLLRSKYATKKELREAISQHAEDCRCIVDGRLEHLNENRVEIWKKIDQMYDWMVTGVIKVNRS